MPSIKNIFDSLPLMLSLQEIVPAAYIQSVGLRGFESHPVGTGPFKFVRNNEGRTIVLGRFEDYYGIAGRVKNFTPSTSGMMDMHDVYVDREVK